MKRTKKPVAQERVQEPEIIIPEVTPINMPHGAVSGYKPAMVAKMLFLAKLGLTVEQLAVAMDTPMSTLRDWMTKHPELRAAYVEGKHIADYGVQASLLQRAMGFEYPETVTRTGTDNLGRKYSHTTVTIKKVLPDVTAMIFWLKNRDPERWRDVHRQEFTGKIDMNLTKTLKLELLSDEERAMVRSVAMKQIQDMNGIGDVDGAGGS